MRKWLCLGIVTLAAGCIGGYWLCSKPASINPVAVRPQLSKGGERHDGDAETSDTIEPLIVESGGGPVLFRPIPLASEEMMPRVLFAPGMQQPPRPDAEANKTPRMPYADEEAILAMPLDPIARILDGAADGFHLFFEELMQGPSRPAAGVQPRIPYCER